jgi:glycosyltransferase involved in cell wall biosynthesis
VNLPIIHVITTIELGGAEKQLLTLAECQKMSLDNVEVLYLKGNPLLLEQFRQAQIEVSTKFSELNFFQQVLELKKKSKNTQAIFHAHLPRSELLCALALKSKSFVVTRHNAEAFFPRAPKFISRILSRFVLRRASACIAISQAVSDYLRDTRESAKSTKVFIIHYGLKNTRRNKSEKIQILTRGIYQIGTVARLVPQKNIPLLLNAIQLLKTENSSDFYLTIVGDGPLKQQLHSLSVELGIDRRVTWKGKISQVGEFYKEVDLFVLPSNYEGFGLVLLEAMSYGVPVVARRISAIPEVLGASHPGLIESPSSEELASKIEELLTNSKAREICLNFQAQQLLKFAIKNTDLAHRSLYECLLERKH